MVLTFLTPKNRSSVGRLLNRKLILPNKALVDEIQQDIQLQEQDNNGSWIFEKIQSRALTTHPVIAFKTVWLIHHLSLQLPIKIFHIASLRPILGRITLAWGTNETAYKKKALVLPGPTGHRDETNFCRCIALYAHFVDTRADCIASLDGIVTNTWDIDRRFLTSHEGANHPSAVIHVVLERLVPVVKHLCETTAALMNDRTSLFFCLYCLTLKECLHEGPLLLLAVAQFLALHIPRPCKTGSSAHGLLFRFQEVLAELLQLTHRVSSRYPFLLDSLPDACRILTQATTQLEAAYHAASSVETSSRSSEMTKGTHIPQSTGNVLGQSVPKISRSLLEPLATATSGAPCRNTNDVKGASKEAHRGISTCTAGNFKNSLKDSDSAVLVNKLPQPTRTSSSHYVTKIVETQASQTLSYAEGATLNKSNTTVFCAAKQATIPAGSAATILQPFPEVKNHLDNKNAVSLQSHCTATSGTPETLRQHYNKHCVNARQSEESTTPHHSIVVSEGLNADSLSEMRPSDSTPCSRAPTTESFCFDAAAYTPSPLFRSTILMSNVSVSEKASRPTISHDTIDLFNIPKASHLRKASLPSIEKPSSVATLSQSSPRGIDKAASFHTRDSFLHPTDDVDIATTIFQYSGKSKERLTDLEIDVEDLVFDKCVGQGAHSIVYKGYWRGCVVGIKHIKGEAFCGSEERIGQSEHQFHQELSLMVRLRHPNLVLFMGASLRRAALCVVMEYCSGGNLFDLLYGTQHKPKTLLTWAQKYTLCVDIAKAMVFLHTASPPIIHRDLKSLNVLLARPVTGPKDIPVAKVSDFGLSWCTANHDGSTSHVKQHRLSSRRGAIGTHPWMAPELIAGYPCTLKTDVYSYGVVLYEILTQTLPETPITSSSKTRSTSSITSVPPDMSQLPTDCPDLITRLMRDCWNPLPEERPSFSQILSILMQFER